METKKRLKKKYEGKEYIIIIKQNQEETEIICRRDDKCSKYTINLKTNYFYLNPFEEIVSEFENNKIEIKEQNEGELILKIRKTFSIKNVIPPYLSNPKKIMEKERYEIELFFLEEKKIYISVKDKDNPDKKYFFKLESKEAIKEVDEMLDNFKELIIDGGKFELKKELDSATLNMEYTFANTLKFERKAEQFIFEINELYEEIRKLEIELDKDKQNENHRIEKKIKEIEKKKDKIQNDSNALGKNIKIMEINAETLIFPKKRTKPEKENGVKMDSYIIKKKKDFDLINNRLNEAVGGEVEYDLLYRSSQERDLARIFKEKCKYIRGTLIIVKTEENEKGKKRIFGGYTTQMWDDSEKNYDDDKAFCFSIDEAKIYELREYCSAIGCDRGSGPRFNWMFMIGNKFMTTGENKGITYKDEVSHYNGQTRDYELTGGDPYFEVYEMEVFKITPK